MRIISCPFANLKTIYTGDGYLPVGFAPPKVEGDKMMVHCGESNEYKPCGGMLFPDGTGSEPIYCRLIDRQIKQGLVKRLEELVQGMDTELA